MLAELMNVFHSIMKESVESIAHGINVPVEVVYMDIARGTEIMKQKENAKADGTVDAGGFMKFLLRWANGGK